MTHEPRTPERLRAHYVIERELAGRLSRATKAERRFLYSQVYDELFQAVPDHPLLTKKRNEAQRTREITRRARLLSRFLPAGSTFLEVGAGDCALAVVMARYARQVCAVDVSTEITRRTELPANVDVILSDGSSIPVPPASVDLAYSNQLMEHLHPQDAADQLRNIARALKPGGVYVCITPNRIAGPHDISMYFTDEPTGLHLREYTTTELVAMLKHAGFSKVAVLVPLGHTCIVLPAFLAMAVEAVLQRLPRRTARTLARASLVRAVLNRVVATA